MTGMAEDVEAMYDLLEEAIKDLREKDPEHELLAFADPVMGVSGWPENREVGEKFLKLFAPSEETVVQARVNYLIAVETVTGKRPTTHMRADERWLPRT